MLAILLQLGCATENPSISKSNNYQVQSRIWTHYSYTDAKKNSYLDAEKVCADKNFGMEVIRAGDTYDSIGWVYIIEFNCYDRAERAKSNQLATERQRVAEVEKERIAEEVRKRNEEERKRYEAEQKAKEAERLRMEALKAAEWERTRPQREAAKRKALAEEESRLNSICPKYFVVRQSCAGAVFSSDCMRLRYGKDFSKQDHDTCFYR
jgi:hypothetical protein